MNNKLKELTDINKQSNFPLFFKEMTVIGKFKGKRSYYSKKHNGMQVSSFFYKPISLIINPEDFNEK